MKTFLLVSGIFLLAACGGGGGGVVTPGGSAMEFPPPPMGESPGTAPTHVLVKPASPLLLDALVDDLGGTVQSAITGTLWYIVGIPDGATPGGYLAQLEADARVLAAELDIGLSAPEGDGRTIPAGGTLFSFELPTQPDLQRLGIDVAHSRATGLGVTIAVLDTGIIAEHAFVQGRLAPGGRDWIDDDMDPHDAANGEDDDGNGVVDEGVGHGLFVASLLLTVAPDAQVLPLRVLGSDNFGRSSAVAAAIAYAVNQGVQVIHLSVDLPAEIEVVREAIQNARTLGIAVIASAGNTGAEDVGSEEAASGAFLVAALAADDTRADFSSFGDGVALSAPGAGLHGAFPTLQDPDTAIWSGTSFSAPLVSGAYALLRELLPLSTADDLLARLQATAASVDGVNPGLAGKLGPGRLDLAAATAP